MELKEDMELEIYQALCLDKKNVVRTDCEWFGKRRRAVFSLLFLLKMERDKLWKGLIYVFGINGNVEVLGS